MHYSVFVFSTRTVLLILFYHLIVFGQPRYGDIGTVRFDMDIHSIPERILPEAFLLLEHPGVICCGTKIRDSPVTETCVLYRKIPVGLFLYPIIAASKFAAFPSQIPGNLFPVH